MTGVVGPVDSVRGARQPHFHPNNLDRVNGA